MLIGTITTNTQVIVGEIQQVGARGYSAYQLALMDGFVGTYEQWRDSLKGDQGDPVPVANTLGQSETIAVSQKLLTDTVDVMQSDNAQAVQRAETAAGNAEGFATTAGQQAGLASGYAAAASVSETQADLYAGEALNQAALADTARQLAQAGATTATTQAGLADDARELAQTAATTATTQAGLALDYKEATELAASGVDAKILVLQTEIEDVLDIINGEQP